MLLFFILLVSNNFDKLSIFRENESPIYRKKKRTDNIGKNKEKQYIDIFDFRKKVAISNTKIKWWIKGRIYVYTVIGIGLFFGHIGYFIFLIISGCFFPDNIGKVFDPILSGPFLTWYYHIIWYYLIFLYIIGGGKKIYVYLSKYSNIKL